MSLFSWLFGGPALQEKVALESSGLSPTDAPRPALKRTGKEAPISDVQPANRKEERMARRELLYSVVREVMTRAGLLSSSYTFKVLSLDARGSQYMVMVDLARASGSATGRLGQVEALIAREAKTRYDIAVTAVYWRMDDHVAVGEPDLTPTQTASHSPPVKLESGGAQSQAPPAATASRPGSHYEAIHPDEVAAFKNALAAGPGAPARRGPHSYTLLTGFEDTELFEGDARPPDLSGTQYGALK